MQIAEIIKEKNEYISSQTKTCIYQKIKQQTERSVFIIYMIYKSEESEYIKTYKISKKKTIQKKDKQRMKLKRKSK